MSSQNFLQKFVNFFPIPKDLSFEFVGIDICQNSVKVLSLKDSKFGKIPVAYKEYELQEKCGLLELDPEYKNCDELAGVLKQVKKEFGVDFVNVSIPEVRTYIYKTEVPIEAAKNINEAITFTVEENIPLGPHEVLVDHFIVDKTDNGLKTVVTAVPKKVIDLYTQLFEDVGLVPVSFEPETHAITRGIIKKGDRNKYLLLNMDKCLSSIAVIEDEVVQYTQTLNTTTQEFSEGFNLDVAKKLKEEIHKVIIYWETSLDEIEKDKISTLFIVGEIKETTDLINYLSKNLPVSVKLGNVWSNCFNLDEYIPKLNAKDSINYATSIGLALKSIK